MQKPRSIRDWGFWLYAVQRHRGLGGFVAFNGSHCYVFTRLLYRQGLHYWSVRYCLHIASPTQFDGTNQAAFFYYFLYCHWLVGLGSWPL